MDSADKNMPSPDILITKLKDFHGKKAYEIATEDSEGFAFGNHGDVLMYRVFRSILELMQIELVDTPESADFLVVRPNGALLENYQFPGVLAKRLKELPDIDLVIFPSSALFPSKDPSFMFKGRSSSTLWIFREFPSFQQVTEKWGNSLKGHGVELFLDHDVVASGHQFVPGILGDPVLQKHILIAGRIDSEAPNQFSATRKSIKTQPNPILRLKKKIVAMISKNPDSAVSRFIAGVIYKTRLESAALNLLSSLPAEVRQEIEQSTLPLKKVDLSSQTFVSFEGYARGVREASIVVTDRLHVALPAAIIGKRVYLVEAGYHKLTGVYRQSLTYKNNVTLINAYSE